MTNTDKEIVAERLREREREALRRRSIEKEKYATRSLGGGERKTKP